MLGDWFATRGAAARNRVALATKIGARPSPGYADLEHVAGLSAPAVREQVLASLRRLRTDRIDLLYTHIDDRTVLLEKLSARSETSWTRVWSGRSRPATSLRSGWARPSGSTRATLTARCSNVSPTCVPTLTPTRSADRP